jgi:adenosylhomocysteinase
MQHASSTPGGSVIKDPALAPEGHRKIDWVAQHAPVLNAIAREQLADGSCGARRSR